METSGSNTSNLEEIAIPIGICIVLVAAVCARRQLKNASLAQVAPSDDEKEKDFYFMHRDIVLGMPTGTMMPRFQEVQQAGHLEMKSIIIRDAFRGAYCGSFLIVSHRWIQKWHPDPEGKQMDEIRQHLLKHPEIKWVWIDWSCTPQVLMSDTCIVLKDRTEEERLYFGKALKSINILYLTFDVLILLDRNYNTRFWCLLETILAMHVCGESGLAPLSMDPARQHHAIICMFALKGTNAAKSLEDEFGGLGYLEALEKLQQPDVEVTNQKDKTEQIERLQKLVGMVKEQWQQV